MNEGLLQLVRDTRHAIRQGAAAVDERQHTRFAALVAYARTHSPYYRDLYKGVPSQVEDWRSLPTTNKEALMARFDEWASRRSASSCRTC